MNCPTMVNNAKLEVHHAAPIGAYANRVNDEILCDRFCTFRDSASLKVSEHLFAGCQKV